MKQLLHRRNILVLLFTVLIASCYKDKGNYDYHDLNEIRISVTSDTVTVQQFDTLKVTPSVTQANPNAASLRYEWYYTNDLLFQTVVLSKEQELSAQVGTTPGSYALYLKVTDTTTGVAEYHRFLMVVTSSLSKGWLVMYDVASDSSDAAIILSTGQTLFNLYANVNQQHLAGKAVAIANFTAGWNRQYLFCLTTAGGAYISPLNFAKQVDYDSSFYGPITNKHPEAIFPNAGTDFIEDHLIDNKRLFNRTWQGPTSLPKYGGAAEGDYEAAPFVVGTPYYNFGPYPVVIYDEKHNRFMYVPLNQSALTTFAQPGTPVFDMNNLGAKKMLFAYNNSTGQTIALFKSKTDNTCYLYKLDFTKSDPAVSVQTVAASPDMPDAVFIDISPTLPLIYYAVQNKVYKYDTEANSSALLYTFPAGTAITALSMLNPQRFKPLPEAGTRIAVGTYTGTQGSMYEFNITPTGSFEGNTYKTKYDGFGRIASLYYKIPL